MKGMKGIKGSKGSKGIARKLAAAAIAFVMLWCACGTAFAAGSRLPAPEKLTFRRGSVSVTVSWDAVAGADGYRVGRYDAGAKKYVYSKPTAETSYRVTGLKPSTSYKFVVASYDAAGGKLVKQSVSKAFKCATTAAPSSLKLSASSKSVTAGKSFTVKAAINPSAFKDVTWKISDSSVAEITGKGASCKVTGLKAGTATLTATAGKRKATCKITVKPSYTGEPTARAQELLPDSTYYFLDDNTHVKPYLDEAEKRKREIFNAKTEIVKSDKFIRGETYTGKAYYVSPNGNDDNDGLSPETAWKNPIRVNYASWGGDIKDGDAVFFERGGVYRLNKESGGLWIMSNVTYSAYGEGAKPVITLARENSAREECWQLYYEDESGKKIWKYYKDMLQTGGIVFDDEDYATRAWEWPTLKGWEAMEKVEYEPVNGKTNRRDPSSKTDIRRTGELLSVEDNLKEDLTFICRTDLSDIEFPLDFSADKYTSRGWQLYLRCDEGNPGALYDDIEVIAPEVGGSYHLLYAFGASGFVLDNISMKYYADFALFADFTRSKDAVVQNCTVEWGGARIYNTIHDNADWFQGNFIGDGIYGIAINAVIKNNYMRCCGTGCTFETVIGYEGQKHDMGTYTCTGNVMENCAQGIRTYLINIDAPFDEVTISDNYVLYSGEKAFNCTCFEPPCGIDLATDFQMGKKITVSGNVVLGSSLCLVRLPNPAEAKTEFKDNVFIQDRNGQLALVMVWIEPDRVEFIPFSG